MIASRSVLLLLVAGFHALSAAAEESAVRGVNPADNLTKFEILPKYTWVDDATDASVSTVTIKYDRAIQGKYGMNVELPLVQFDSDMLEKSGVGDTNVRGRIQFGGGQWTFITGMEAVLPTASDDALGAGKYQTNPTFAAVYAFSAQTFAVGVIKHHWSVAGDDERADINMGMYRAMLAHTTTTGWWFLLDPQLWVDYENDGREHFAPELEVGKMIARTTGVWVRCGKHVAGSWEKDQWNISGGVRFISF